MVVANFEVGTYLTVFLRLCGPINPKDEKNVENLFASLATNFASVTQYASLKKYSTKNEYTSVTMKTLCDIMVNATSKAVSI